MLKLLRTKLTPYRQNYSSINIIRQQITSGAQKLYITM